MVCTHTDSLEFVKYEYPQTTQSGRTSVKLVVKIRIAGFPRSEAELSKVRCEIMSRFLLVGKYQVSRKDRILDVATELDTACPDQLEPSGCHQRPEVIAVENKWLIWCPSIILMGTN